MYVWACSNTVSVELRVHSFEENNHLKKIWFKKMTLHAVDFSCISGPIFWC
jgi:hypothetical protein